MIRLVAIDLDGTLLSDDKSICDRNKKAIAEAVRQGVKIVLCSGRSYDGMLDQLKELDLVIPGQYAVGLNGGIVFTTVDGDLKYRAPMTPPDVQAMIDIGRELKDEVNTQVYDGRNVFVENWDFTTDFYQKVTHSVPRKIECLDTLAEEAVKIVYFMKGENPPRVNAPIGPAIEMQKKVNERKPAGVSTAISAPYLVECTGDADKGSGLKILGDMIGIHLDEMIAIGDLDNDLPMLRACGLGAAVKNAAASVKKEADIVTEATNNEGAVGEVIEKYVLAK